MTGPRLILLGSILGLVSVSCIEAQSIDRDRPAEIKQLIKFGRLLEASALIEAAVQELETVKPGQRIDDELVLGQICAELHDNSLLSRLRQAAGADIEALTADTRGGDLSERLTKLQTVCDALTKARQLGPIANASRSILDVAQEIAGDLPQSTVATGAPAEHQAEARSLLECLVSLHEESPAALGCRGMCHLYLNNLALAVEDLTLANARGIADPHVRLCLARALWRTGDHARSYAVLRAAQDSEKSREATEVFATILRHEKREGRRDTAEADALAWVKSCDSSAASPLWVFLGECRVEACDLSGAIAACSSATESDRNWLFGGITRLARATAAVSPAERKRVRTLLTAYMDEHTRESSPLLLVGGDLAIDDRDRQVAARSYASSLTSGEAEADSLLSRMRDRAQTAGTTVAAGDIGQLLEGENFSGAANHPIRGALFTGRDEAYRRQLITLAMSEIKMARADSSKVDHAVKVILGVANQGPDAAHFYNPSQNLPPDSPPLLADLDLQSGPPLGEQTVSTFFETGKTTAENMPSDRLDLIWHYIRGDREATLTKLDVLAMSDWRSSRNLGGAMGSVVVGRNGIFAPGFATASNNEVDPQFLSPFQKVAATQAALSRNTDEPIKLRRVLDVASVREDWTPPTRDPIVIDLNGNGRADLTMNDQNIDSAVSFDLLGFGNRQRIQWLAPNADGWLCQDTDHDGKITSGLEMFGSAGGYADGFEKLAQLDVNHDGIISGAELATLSVWKDVNGDGVTDPGELVSALALGIESITVPKVGLRSTCVIKGVPHLVCEVWPTVLGVDQLP